MRVLMVEDEAGLVDALRIELHREGYAVDDAPTVAVARDKLAVTDYDLVLLDVTLPDGDGVALAGDIRSGALRPVAAERPGGPVPVADVGPRILMLTARSSLRDRVRGLDSGADDYLVKPFALVELTARMRALLRREGGASSSAVSSVLRDGPIALDAARQIATRGERVLTLTRKEFGLLRYLLRRTGYVVSAEELLEHVWDENADPFTQTVRVTIGTLRRKLTVEGEEPAIETVTGRGYRLRELS